MCVCVSLLSVFPNTSEMSSTSSSALAALKATRRDAVDGREEDDDDQLYDVARVAEWIRANAFGRIAMQIPRRHAQKRRQHLVAN